ncbi:nephrin [Anopheles sinensis]|uniref:Nephrin n=1 Tax=Anopheles sinensis TaxID=74873 RepID=A0A084WAS1_ANOSI|nr:nephrin [Anopheles sinensis]
MSYLYLPSTDAATIKSASENVIVNPGEDAVLNCTVDGKPLTPEHVRWERAGYDLKAKTSTAYANGTSQLVLRDAQREDVGHFRCIADNRVAGPASRDVLLIVKCRYLHESAKRDLYVVLFESVAPEIDKSPAMLRAAAGTGERARLPCRAQAAPTPTFRWIRSGQELHVNETSKYYVIQSQPDALTHESVLLIERIATSDYGEYECRAENELGVGSGVGRLDVKSAPEPPVTLTVLNVTHDSVTLGWTPGFDGGHRANYRVRYREAASERYRYEDSPPNAHQLTLTGLRSNTHYLFSVMAANVLGASNYLPDLTRAQTKVFADRRPQSSAPVRSVRLKISFFPSFSTGRTSLRNNTNPFTADDGLLTHYPAMIKNGGPFAEFISTVDNHSHLPAHHPGKAPLEFSSFLASSSPIGASGLLLLGFGVAAGICLVLLNILLLVFCLHRRLGSSPGGSPRVGPLRPCAGRKHHGGGNG